MLTFKLAARNLWRHKRRTLITAAAIIFSFALLVLFMGIADGGHRQMIDMGVRMGSGHVVIQATGYQDDRTLDHRVEDVAAVTAAIGEAGIDARVARRLFSSGLARAGNKSVGVAIAGVDPIQEQATNDIASDDKRIRGGWLRPSAEMRFQNALSDIYIGSVLAETLEVDLGDRVALTVQPKDDDRGNPRSAAFQVRGVFRTGNDELDGFFLYIPLDEAQELNGVGGSVSQIALILPDQDRTPAVHDALAARLECPEGGIDVLPWQEALPELYEFILLDDASFYLFMGIIFILVAMGIFNTILTSVIERTREFGLLTALGSRPRRIVAVVMLEAVLIGFIGLVLGSALGLAGNAYFEAYGLDYAALAGSDSLEAVGLNLATVLYSDLPEAMFAKSLIAVFAVVLLSALWPAIRAARLKTLEALQHV